MAIAGARDGAVFGYFEVVLIETSNVVTMRIYRVIQRKPRHSWETKLRIQETTN